MHICNKMVVRNHTGSWVRCYTALWSINTIFRMLLFTR